MTEVKVIQLTEFYLLHPPGSPQAVTAVNGKLILAKYVRSENEKEEEEHISGFFFFSVGHLSRGGGVLCGRNSEAVTVMPGK